MTEKNSKIIQNKLEVEFDTTTFALEIDFVFESMT